jgi:hypothetical protein
MIAPTSANIFSNGLVFGFDVGTGSIGYAVRKGSEFKDVGVLICDSEGSDYDPHDATGRFEFALAKPSSRPVGHPSPIGRRAGG